jgi:DNA polymerase I-like protein with 3'-5' exonuclease and polymerase domains
LLQYCAEDVEALEKLLPAMLDHIALPYALIRGRYMAALAQMEHTGVPIDVPLLSKLRSQWESIQGQLVAGIDSDYGVYDGTTFKHDRFEAWLTKAGIPWPRLPTGRLDLKADTFKEQSKAHLAVAPLAELRSSLAKFRLGDLVVGSDGRNRTMLSAFRSATGRNQPSSDKFVFGTGAWLRGLVRPPEGMGLAMIDWGQQEFGIAGSLSGDRAMMDAYLSGDPYLTFAKQAGAVPAEATKQSHGAQRELFKQCVLAVQYGMQAESLAVRIGQPVVVASALLASFRETYKVFWKWSDRVVDCAVLRGNLETAFGWKVRATAGGNHRFFRNYLMQGNGSEMMRIACCLATERGIEVCAPIHDAFLIAAPLDRLEEDVAAMQVAMREASAKVLAGFELQSDVKIIRYPDRYTSPRGEVMWKKVMELVGEGE